jgi:prepilin-type N-terminal cleavage/methylation domain-containing protein
VTRIRKLLAQESGYSLVELITVMAMMAVVLSGVTDLFVTGSNAELDMNRRYQAQQGARVALDRMRRDIHCSSAVVGPASSTTLVLTDPCSSTGTISWCTVAVSGTSWYTLYRSTSSTCDATKTDYADNLVDPSGNVFTFAQQSTSSLASVAIDLQVNLKPAMTQSTYVLDDTVVLRNSTRTCVVAVPPSVIGSPSPPC